ncbi:MAG TPA: hypothetical protein VKE70_35435, partial [Candidatus Solibacter sp.]|nr:hypothetical protein [Candidatus Solibacter sp.]
MKARRVPPPNPEHLKFLQAYDPTITELVVATRALVLELAPDSVELIYDAFSAVSAGYSFTGRQRDSFVYIAAYAKGVNLAGCGKTEVRQPISHDRSRRISGLRCEIGVRPRFFRNLLEHDSRRHLNISREIPLFDRQLPERGVVVRRARR